MRPSARPLERARAGGGPTLIEAVTYRLSDHTTSDDATKYREGGESRNGKRRIRSNGSRLISKTKGLWNEAFETEVQEAAAESVEKAVAEAEAVPPPSVEDLFAYHLLRPCRPNLKEQLDGSGDPPREVAR